jgi:hypothetical protein
MPLPLQKMHDMAGYHTHCDHFSAVLDDIQTLDWQWQLSDGDMHHVNKDSEKYK